MNKKSLKVETLGLWSCVKVILSNARYRSMYGGENMLVRVRLDMLWMEVMAGGDAGCLADGDKLKPRRTAGREGVTEDWRVLQHLCPKSAKQTNESEGVEGPGGGENRRRDGAGRRMKNEWETTEPISPSNKHSSWISFSDRQRWRGGEKKIRVHKIK